MSEGGTKLEAHFESMERQADAARFGMWVFLSSEALLFGALFTLYACYREKWPHAFEVGVAKNDALLGTTNTLLLIASSFLVVLGIDRYRRGDAIVAARLVASTAAIGLLFLLIKSHEYAMHFSDGIFPGGHGAYFAGAPAGAAVFFTLYFTMTGLHAIHVTVGMGVLVYCAVQVHRRKMSLHGLQIAALYWHLVDCIWIFLWPLYYLARGS
jgi:cytochrome c oxidase subunit 3